MAGLWFDEDFENRVRFGLNVKRTLLRAQSEYQAVDVVDTDFGKTLLLGGAYMTSVADEFFYHEMLVHPALTCAPSIKRVLVIGGGDGGTVREVLRYREVEQVVLAELDGLVVDACKEHLPEFNVPWNDPRLSIRIGDGVAFLRDYTGDLFDVILVDGPDPVGPAEGLFESPFYQSCRARLTPEGVLASQTEAPFVMHENFVRIVKTLRNVFGKVHPYFGQVPIYPCGSWSWTFASNAVGPDAPREDRLKQIEAGCRYYNRDIHRAAFVQPTYIRKALG
jgi:spermidine synthase